MPIDREHLATSFRTGGVDYDRLRPGYPPAAVTWLVPDGARAVADIGAGTGKLSRTLADAGFEVYAVDPSADMLAQLSHPRVTTRVGTGEHTGLPEASVDAVTYAQAWHWVNPVDGAREAARILRPRGVLGLLWNLLDTSVPWVARYAQALHSVDTETPGFEGETYALDPPDGFEPWEERWLPWQQVMTAEEAAQLAFTRSYWLRASEVGRTEALERVRAEIATAPLSADGRIALPYVTQLARAVRSD